MGIELIVAALTAGAAAASKDVATQAVKDAYAGFKVLLGRHFANKPEAQTALQQYEVKPEVWRAPLEDALDTSGAGKDPTLLDAARDLQELAERELAGASATGANARAVNTNSGPVAMDNAVVVDPHFGNISGSSVTVAGRDATGGSAGSAEPPKP